MDHDGFVMDQRIVTASALVFVLLVGLLAGASVPAGAATNYQSPHDACEATDGDVIVLLPHGEVLEDSTALYAGTSIQVALCDGDRVEPTESAWTLEPTDGFEPHEEPREGSWGVELTEEATDTVELLEQIPERDGDGFSLTVHTGTITATGVDDPETVTLSSADQLDEFETARADAEVAREDAIHLAGQLSDENDLDELGQLASETETAVAELDETHDRLQGTLFESALTGNDDAAIALATYDAEADTARESLDDATAEAKEQAERETTDARLSIGMLLGGSSVGGMIVGMVVGRQLSKPTVAQFAHERRYNESTTVGARDLWKPAAVVLVVLIGTVVALFLLDGVTILLEGRL